MSSPLASLCEGLRPGSASQASFLPPSCLVRGVCYSKEVKPGHWLWGLGVPSDLSPGSVGY